MKLWRFGQIQKDIEWGTFFSKKMLSLNWLNPDFDYRKVKNNGRYDGRTCVKPWTEELRKGDIIFMVSKYLYGGVAIAKERYNFKENDFNVNNNRMPGVPVEYIHFLSLPVSHNIVISHRNPRAFSRIGELGFSAFSIMEFIKSNYPDVYEKVSNYILGNLSPEAEKISRVCWNTNGWRFPSGPDGKTLQTSAYENINKFGHEEWLANKTRIINGYCYGFLQTLNMKSNHHADKIYRIFLYTIKNNGTRYLIGEIKNAYCVSKEESKFAYSIYKKSGWLDNLVNDLKHFGIKRQSLLDTYVEIFFNVKYKPTDIIIYDDFIELSPEDNNITTAHYKLLDKGSNFRIIKTDNSDDDDNDEDRDKSTNPVTKKLREKQITYNPIHNDIQNILKKYLRTKKEYKKVKAEVKGVDVWAKTQDDKLHFYEIKTNSPKKSIREAFGQIMEYSCWPELYKAEKLIIVTDSEEDEDVKKYMEHLRKKFNIPVYYMYYSFAKKTFSKLI